MVDMTEEEAEALDELWTKTTPAVKMGAGGGFFAEHRAQMVILDMETAVILNAGAKAVSKTPSEVISSLIRREFAHV